MLKPTDLKCNRQNKPFGITGSPVFSWKLISDERDTIQTAYQISITRAGQHISDSGKVISGRSIEVCVSEFFVHPAQIYDWSVKVWDNHGNETTARSFFEAAPEVFTAKWIEPSNAGIRYEKPISILANTLFHAKPKLPVDQRLMPVTLLRKEFSVKPYLRKARIYATAHGTYQISLNGKRPDNRLLAPEYTAYEKYLCYQTYDVTAMLQAGQNVCGIWLADGWWGGRIGISGECGQYGLSRAFLMQMELEYCDGSCETVISDESFVWSDDGEIRYSDIFIGEKQDHTFAANEKGFDYAGFNADSWQSVIVKDYGYDNLKPQIGAPVMPICELPVREIIRTPRNEIIVDFGQVFAGFVRFKASEKKGTVIKLEHTEILDERGNFLNNIMGVNKDQTDFFICSGESGEVFEPQFTFHGFRYVRVTGLSNLETAVFIGVAISSTMDNTGIFSCGNELLNKLYSNVRWSQYSNMISIPTDCPQRERAGWTGDIQVFAPTAIFNQDMQSFLERWLESMEAEQFDDGQVPCIIPYTKSYKNQLKAVFREECSTGWSDACLIVPYVMYRLYGNLSVLKRHYPMMKRWMDYAQKQAEQNTPKSFQKKRGKTAREIENQKYLWNTGWHFGDWLIPSLSKSLIESTKSGKVTKEVIAPMYYAYEVRLMTEISAILGCKEDADKYKQLFTRIKTAFAETYITPDGLITPNLQGIYVCALWFELVPKEIESKIVSRLVDLISANDYRLDTGFLATPVLLDVLTKYGHKDIVYKLLYQEKYPSWLYEIRKGATTIWENWGAIRPDGKVSTFSYNHYALGCVCDWMYRYIGGIRNASVGYEKIIIKPEPDETLQWAESGYESVYGEIYCKWKKENGHFNLRVRIPCNSSATIKLPDGSRTEIGSGQYEFECQII
jgi:alpha-L-rhamnosidase